MPEIELKLRGAPARLKAAVARLEKTAVKDSSFRKTLRAVYFDTAKDDLCAKGLSLRVRDEDGRFVQTLKQTDAGADALARGEWSDDIASPTPELVTTDSGRRLRQVWRDVRLLPRFQTDIARRGFLVRPRRGAVVEVVLDLGEIHAAGRDVALPVAEIELELKKGGPGAIYDVALQLLDQGPFRIEPRSKSDRGYSLIAADGRTSAVKADAAAAQESEMLAETLRAAARRHFGQFLANMAGAAAHDADSIHQMRVAMRRLRAALYAVRDRLPEASYESVRLKLKALLQFLGAARDWEVLTERLSDIDDAELDDLSTQDDVRHAADAQRRRALLRAADVLGSREGTRTLLEAMRWFEDLPGSRDGAGLKTSTDAAAARILAHLFARVRRRGRHFGRLSVAERHRLRIACKTLRYNIELFGALYDRRAVGRFLKRIKPVQDDLGHLNDVSRAHDLLGDLAKSSPRKAAADAVVARLDARVAAADSRVRKHVTALRKAKPFW